MRRWRASVAAASSNSTRGRPTCFRPSTTPALELRATPLASVPLRFFFGQNPDSPFRDERVRQAWSMTWNRDAYIDATFGLGPLRNAGLPVTTAWDTCLSAGGWKGWWLDPKSKDFGPNARTYTFAIDEARKLLTAAGFANGLDVDLHHAAPGPASYPQSYFDQAAPLEGMPRDSGLFRVNVHVYDYATDWQARIRNVRGAFTGVAWWPDVAAADPAQALYSVFSTRSGSLFQGGDAFLDDAVQRLLLEFDAKKRVSIALEVQRHDAETVFSLKAGGAGGFRLSWPALRNVLVYQGGTNRDDATLFLDPTQAPLAH